MKCQSETDNSDKQPSTHITLITSLHKAYRVSAIMLLSLHLQVSRRFCNETGYISLKTGQSWTKLGRRMCNGEVILQHFGWDSTEKGAQYHP